MTKQKTNVLNNPDLVTSKCTYKKLGTIVEHLIDCINPLYFEVKIAFTQNPSSAYIRVYPLNPPINVIVYPVWELVWTPYFSDRLVANRNILSPLTEW